MTLFERTVLEILSRSSDSLGWYQIERRLSKESLLSRPHLPSVLLGLRERGYIEETQLGVELHLRYMITASGRGALAQNRTTAE
jgi:hypothetical protein